MKNKKIPFIEMDTYTALLLFAYISLILVGIIIMVDGYSSGSVITAIAGAFIVGILMGAGMGLTGLGVLWVE